MSEIGAAEEPEQLVNTTDMFKTGWLKKNYPKEYWFVLFILIYAAKYKAYKCTGSLLKPNWVLTTGNCMANEKTWARNLIVVANRGNLNKYLRARTRASFEKVLVRTYSQERRVLYYRVHPLFDKIRSLHDVALLKLRRPFTMAVSFGILSPSRMMKKFENCTIVGFGLQPPSEVYRFADLTIRNITNLTVSQPSLGCPTPVEKKIGMNLCFNLTRSPACKGELGTPLLCKGEIWAISTSTITKKLSLHDGGCYPDGNNYYTSLYPEIKWITTIISRGEVTVSGSKFFALLALLLGFVCIL